MLQEAIAHEIVWSQSRLHNDINQIASGISLELTSTCPVTLMVFIAVQLREHTSAVVSKIRTC